jgi:hypothetical protein
MSKNILLITTVLSLVLLSACSTLNSQVEPTVVNTAVPTPEPKGQLEPATPTPTSAPNLPV